MARQHEQQQQSRQDAERDSSSSGTPKNRCLRIARKVFNFVLAQWLIIGFGVGCVLGYFFPRELEYYFVP